MATRRSFLQVLGFAPVAAPLAAKAAAEKAIGDLVGISNIPGPAAMGAGIGLQDRGGWKDRVLRFIANNTLPDWFDDEIRYRCKNVGYIDPDIASKRSWSMNVKISHQRVRNIERARSEWFKRADMNIRIQEFQEKTGMWL